MFFTVQERSRGTICRWRQNGTQLERAGYLKKKRIKLKNEIKLNKIMVIPLLVGERMPRVRSSRSAIGAERTTTIRTAKKTETFLKERLN